MAWLSRIFAAAILLLVAKPAAYGEEWHSLPQSQRTEICAKTLPAYLGKLCAGSGSISNMTLNMPELCRRDGAGDAIEQALRACGEGNVYTDIAKYRYGLISGVPKSIVAFAKDYGMPDEPHKTRMASLSLALSSILYLFCQRDVTCYAKFLAALPDNDERALTASPLFCDFSEQALSVNPRLDDFLRRTTRPEGFEMPVCRRYYCQVKDCAGVPAATAEPFILSPIWDAYYDKTFGATGR